MFDNLTELGKQGIELAKKYSLYEFYNPHSGIYTIPNSRYQIKEGNENVERFLMEASKDNDEIKYMLSFNPPCEEAVIFEPYWYIYEREVWCEERGQPSSFFVHKNQKSENSLGITEIIDRKNKTV